MIVALPARAKLNLDLTVVGRRADGFHDIKTTMQTIALHDLLTLESVAGETAMSVSGIHISDTDNSVRKAHAALERASGKKLAVSMHLDKRIPPGSGLGGASSDAAAALIGLKSLFRLDVELSPIAEELGSDMPFFLHGGTALVEGRGERVTPVPTTAAWWFAIAWPGIELSTGAVYQAWDEVKGDDLRRAAEHVEPRIKDFADALGDGWRMTGSGSAFFKATSTPQEAEQAVANLHCWTAVTR